VVLVLEWIAEVVAKLELWGQAAHGLSGDLAGGGQAVGWVLAPGVAVELLPAVAVHVEDDWVQVDPRVLGVA